MTQKLITDHLKHKGFKVLDITEENKIQAYNLNTSIVISWVITNNTKYPNRVAIAYKESTDIRFRGNIENLQQLNLILKLVE